MAAAAVFSCAILPASASASVVTSGGISYVSKPEADLFDDHTIVTRCPAGTHVLSGGQSNGGGFDTARQIHSYPVDGDDDDHKLDDGWATRVLTTTAVNFTFWAICAPIPVTYVKEKVDSPPSGEADGEDAKCPGPKVAVGGGMSGDFNVYQMATFPLGGREWTNHFGSNYDGNRKLTMYASCVHANARMFQDDDTQVPSNSQGSARVKCKGHRQIYGGGVLSTGLAGETTVNSTFPLGGGLAPDDEWVSYTDNYDGGEDHLMISYAMCGPSLN